MESQLQNPDFRNNPENIHRCIWDSQCKYFFFYCWDTNSINILSCPSNDFISVWEILIAWLSDSVRECFFFTGEHYHASFQHQQTTVQIWILMMQCFIWILGLFIQCYGVVDEPNFCQSFVPVLHTSGQIILKCLSKQVLCSSRVIWAVSLKDVFRRKWCSAKPRHHFAYQWLDNVKMNKYAKFYPKFTMWLKSKSEHFH